MQEPEDWDVMDEYTAEPLQQLLNDADAARLAKCLQHLDERQQESLRLAFFQGLTHSELSEKLAIPLGTVKAWIRRGLEKLKGCLHEI
jgi:RNA polymerase sigma-70 factor (ECF subfamily)